MPVSLKHVGEPWPDNRPDHQQHHIIRVARDIDLVTEHVASNKDPRKRPYD